MKDGGARVIQIFSSSIQIVHRIDTERDEAPQAMLALPSTSSPSEERRHIANLEIRPGELQVLADGTRVGFTVREFELFFLLAERPDSVVQRPLIYELIWGGEMPRRDRSVDVLVRKVRAKLEETAPNWRYIHTHFGIGYRFTPEQITD